MMCEVLEQVMLLHALTGDHAAVAVAATGMLPAERQVLRQALSDVTVALGLDCAACGGIVPLREAVSVGPLGGPYQHYHRDHWPASGKTPASQVT
jgi:hypothetical protein